MTGEFYAYESGDYETALRELRPIAEQGNPIAQVVVGDMYAKGLGVEQDEGKAFKREFGLTSNAANFSARC